MPTIEQSLIPVASYPNLFASPFGNDDVPKMYSSLPVPSPNPGACLPCVICGATASNWSATLNQIVENAPSQGATTSASLAFSPPPDCCLYPSIGFGSLFTETGLPDNVNVNSVLMNRVGSAYGDTTNGVRIESGLWAVYLAGVRTTQSCLIAGSVTDTFYGSYVMTGIGTVTRESVCRWTGTDVNGCAIILYWNDVTATWAISNCGCMVSSTTGSSNPSGTFSGEGCATITVTFPPLILPLRMSFPMDMDGTNPPADVSGNGYTLSVVDGATVQSGVVLPGKSYAGYVPPQTNPVTLLSRWTIVDPTGAKLTGVSFIIDLQVYLPASGINPDFPWYGNPAVKSQNIIYGGGAPDSYAPRIGVTYNTALGIRELSISGQQPDATMVIVGTGESFPLDQWVHVRAEYDVSVGHVRIFQNGTLKRDVTGAVFGEYGPGPMEYELGAAEYNGPFTFSWGGYISEFKLYL